MDIEDIKVEKIETRKPVLKNGKWQLRWEAIEYTDDKQQSQEENNTS